MNANQEITAGTFFYVHLSTLEKFILFKEKLINLCSSNSPNIFLKCKLEM